MHRLVYAILFILIITALIGGIRIGKKLQTLDTPVKMVQKTVLITNEPKALVRYTLACGFIFTIPENINAQIASTSATVTMGKNVLNIACVSANAKASSGSDLYKNTAQNSTVEVRGEKSLLNLVKSGFDPRYTKTVR